MNTTYQNRASSSYQKKNEVFNTTTSSSPVRHLINSCTKTHTISVAFEQDIETFSRLNNPGVIAFLCTLKKGQQVLGIGRGHTVLNSQSKFFEKLVFTALNYSFIDAVSKATRGLNTLYTGPDIQLQDKEVVTGGYTVKTADLPQMITDRQRSYLEQLISSNVADSEERDRWFTQLSEMTTSEASDAIQSFKN